MLKNRSDGGRKTRLGSWLLQGLVAVALWVGITQWQERNLLSDRVQAPAFSLASFDGNALSLDALKGQRFVLYFFAPWCSVCKLSMTNLAGLNVASTTVVAIALSYGSVYEVRGFIADRDLSLPVLLGSPVTGADYRIEMFPTYYVLDASKAVVSKSVGFSTKVGLKARAEWL